MRINSMKRYEALRAYLAHAHAQPGTPTLRRSFEISSNRSRRSAAPSRPLQERVTPAEIEQILREIGPVENSAGAARISKTAAGPAARAAEAPVSDSRRDRERSCQWAGRIFQRRPDDRPPGGTQVDVGESAACPHHQDVVFIVPYADEERAAGRERRRPSGHYAGAIGFRLCPCFRRGALRRKDT